MTVHRVFREDPKVSEETRQMIMDTAEKMGFAPKRLKRVGAESRWNTYYVIFQDAYSLSDAYFSDIILGIQSELFAKGCCCSFGVLTDSYPEFVRLRDMMTSENANGLFIVGDIQTSCAKALRESFDKIVFIDYPGTSLLGREYDAVTNDNQFGAHLALEHLIKLGRRKILLVSGIKNHYFSNDLQTAYEQTLQEYGIELNPSLITYGDVHVSGGHEAVKKAIESGVEFDAIFTNDEMACGAIKALNEAGISVPKDVSVVGFDGLPLGEAVSPAITTVAVDRKRMAALAVEKMLSQHDSNSDGFQKTTIFPKLIVRESCGAQLKNGES